MTGRVKLLDSLRNLKDRIVALKKLYVPDFKPQVYTVDVDFIASRLEKLPNWNWNRWLPLDGIYYTVTMQDFERMADWDISNRHKYILDRFDCDKYAVHFKASMAWHFGVNAIGVVLDYGVGHAYNIVFPIDKEEPVLYEPQTDTFFEVKGRDKRFYGLEEYYVMV